ncbi:hypothetical protein [Methanoculleus sp. UBA303]|uniref:hypothetical protein n=1 Tax=Methanoculleus sp. UBA303 TaxID=1915497 RepID=UPI0025EE8F00|nr:hypothetical protein [Methanoculleus sp. UBA303]
MDAAHAAVRHLPSAPGKVSVKRPGSVMLPSMNVTRRGGARSSPRGEVLDDDDVVTLC